MKPHPSIDSLETIDAVNRALASGEDVRANVRSALREMSDGIGANYAFFAIPGDDNDSLHLAETFGLDLSDFRRLESSLGDPAFRNVFQTNSASHIDATELGITDSMIVCVPAIAGKRTSGVVGIGVAPNRDLDPIEKVIRIAASMIAQTMRIEQAIRGEREQLREENLHLKQELKEKYDFTNIVGNSNPMKIVYEQISQVAKSNATVLLRGESGTGKEMIANAIHYNSLRSRKPFIKINCAAIPETLIESELFGHGVESTGFGRSSRPAVAVLLPAGCVADQSKFAAAAVQQVARRLRTCECRGVRCKQMGLLRSRHFRCILSRLLGYVPIAAGSDGNDV